MIWFLVGASWAQLYLNGAPLSFSITGPTSYIPDVGGAAIQGYGLSVSYGVYSWLAVQLEAGGSKDVLVFQPQSDYTENKGHSILISDYYLSGSGSLNADTSTQGDKNPKAFTKTIFWSLSMVRPLSGNGGQDWDPNAGTYGMSKICFYSGEDGFSSSNYKGDYSLCTYFSLQGLVSTVSGGQLNVVKVGSLTFPVYGYVGSYPPTLSITLFIDQPLGTLTQAPAFLLNTGVSSLNVDDFIALGPTADGSGDFFGNDAKSAQEDKSEDGYTDCVVSYVTHNIGGTTGGSRQLVTARAVRQLATYDFFDADIDPTTFKPCLYLFSGGSPSGAYTDKVCFVALPPIYSMALLLIAAPLFILLI